ncbi:uncharacterized protein EV154DRAFT_608434 [Mucor mucedo]|uniref:uncharacterized protein n=1 Tax=Mucor mucedo TaxID=29922 RepID=UPI00221F12EB|nr:uncharacterized protein EV154DRAFT_608434 [Mucor mucedo]KAI7862834.1 hypothetical protein EV154DRAFT_608434 [Mucor mucedo]
MIPTRQLYTSPDALNAQSAGSQSMDQLAEFASSMVYVMWHGRKITNMTSSGGYRNSLWQGGSPTSSFQRFCSHVFKATAIHESAVYLCLKYVALLLQLNPTMEGSEGSEYRLFVVALILACKFLDDNTFANSTWSEVSGMKLRDLNLMEAEFMEAIHYRLFIRSQDFNQWKTLADVCRDRLSCYYLHTRPLEQEQFVLSILYTIGLRPMQPSVSVAPRVVAPPPVAVIPIALPTTTAAGAATGSLYTSYDIYCDEIEAARIKQYQNSYNRYQHFMQSVSNHVNHDHPVQHQPTVQPLQPPIGAPAGYPITNLSESTWDPLFYSIYGSMYNTYQQQPISWSNF